MKQFITYRELREIAEKIPEKRAYMEARASRRVYNTFLSHSTADDELVPGVVKVLEGHGATVYVDDIDERLPEKPSPETAKILKDSIDKCRRFVLFVTPNSKESRWIPWELGLGDGIKKSYSVALFPSAENWYETTWSEQEYLGLYQRIIWGTFKGKDASEWMVLNHHENTATPLGDWIRGN